MRSEPRWLRALCRSEDPVYVVNDAQRIVCWNGAAEKLLGYSEFEVLNRPCYQIIAGKVSGKSWCHAGCAVHRSAKRGLSLQNIEMQTRTRGGEPVWLNTSVFTLERRSRKFTIHLLRDMTREGHMKEALERLLTTLRSYGVGDGNQEAIQRSEAHRGALPTEVSLVARLTRREIEVLELLAQGLSTKALAQRLGVSPFTVRRHVEAILLKTGLHTQAQAVAYAYRAGLL